MEGMTNEDLKLLKTSPDFVNINLTAMKHADAIIQGSDKISPELASFFKKTDKPNLGYHNVDEYIKAYYNFYDELLVGQELLTE
jgi:starch synthase